MPWMPEAIKQTNIRGAGGGSYARPPNKVVWHKTQGSTAAGAFGVYASMLAAPHFTTDGSRIYQHIDTNRSAYALRNVSGGVETNRDGAIQIEVVGFSGTDNLAAVKNAKKVKDWIEKTHGIPSRWPGGRPPREYVSHSGFRSVANWSQSGNFGHSQVPENHHWDPAWTDAEWAIMGSGSTVSLFNGLNIGGLKVARMSKKELLTWHQRTRRITIAGVAKLLRAQDERWKMGIEASLKRIEDKVEELK